MSNYSKRKQAEALRRKEENKKTLISVLIFVAVVAAIVFGFWYGDKLRDKKNQATGDPNYDVFDYVKLGQYKDLELYYIIPEVTDEELQEKIDSIIASKVVYSEFKDREVKKGDKVTIDFVGTIDGKEFEGGTSKDYTYVLGEGKMIDGFDEGIYGMKMGEEKTIEVTFPEDYSKKDLQGKKAQFKITMKKGQEVTKQPEWNDEFVSEYSKGEYKTVADYEKYLYDAMLASATEASESQLENDMWKEIFDGSVINGYPDYLYNTLNKSITSNIESTAAYYGLTTAQYMQYFAGGLSIHEYVLQYVESSLITKAIIKDMGLELPEERYQEYAKSDLEYYGVKNVKELEKKYGKEALVEYYLEIYLSEVLHDMCKITEVSADEYEKLTKTEAVEK